MFCSKQHCKNNYVMIKDGYKKVSTHVICAHKKFSGILKYYTIAKDLNLQHQCICKMSFTLYLHLWGFYIESKAERLYHFDIACSALLFTEYYTLIPTHYCH